MKMGTAKAGRRLLTGLLFLGVSLGAQAATLTRTSAFVYDPGSGLLTKEIIEPDNSNLCLVTEYVYDAYGNKTSATTRNCNGSSGEAAAPAGDAVIASRTTSNAYDAHGQFPISSTNALSQSESKTFDARFGVALSLTGPNGLTTTWQYDGFGRKTKETRADGTQTKWDYLYCNGINGGTATCPTIGGAAGAWVLVATPLAADGVTQNGPISKTYHDGLNREIRVETQGYDGNGSTTAIYKDTQYDSLGRPYKVSRPYYAGQTAYWATLAYDSLGRVIEEIQPDNATTSTSYNGLTITVTNAKGQTGSSTKNSQGKVVKVVDTQNQNLTYTYDPFGNLLTTTDPRGNITTLTYDLRGRKTSMQDPDMGSWTYAYDALGQLIRQTDAKGQVSTLNYDRLGRLVKRSEPDLISNWYYDTYKGGAACQKGIGKLCESETDSGYRATISYDTLGRPTGGNTTIDTSYAQGATYDANGRVATRSYPNGLVAKHTYTALGYLKEVRNNASNALYWRADSLDAEGHVLTQTYGNGVQGTQSYNAANGRITAITAGAGNVVQNLGYQYDSLGNITTRTDANQSLTETFVYDSLNRLASSTVNSGGAGLVTVSYTYDALGNIVSKSDLGTYTYNPGGVGSVRPHAVSQIALAGGGAISFAYDANGALATQTQVDAAGNPVAGKSRSQFYSSFGMPQAMAQGGTSAAFYYGPDHQRVKQISSAQGTTIYVNPGNEGALFFEKDIKPDNSVEQRAFITAGGQAVAIYKTITAGGNTTNSVRYLHRDNLGSTTAVTNETGAVVERLAYEPFGKRRFPAGNADPNGTIMPVNTERGFTNHEHIDELGLIHMNGRIYDPAIGRFVSADPIIQAPLNLQSYNRYTYVWNNPLVDTDPSGYFSLRSFAWSVTKFSVVPSPRNTFNMISAQPGQQYIDRFVMANPWAYTAGQWIATAATSVVCGGCGGAMWTAYYTYKATGSTTKATAMGALTYASNWANQGNTGLGGSLLVKGATAAASAKISGGDAGRAFAMAVTMEGLRIALNEYKANHRHCNNCAGYKSGLERNQGPALWKSGEAGGVDIESIKGPNTGNANIPRNPDGTVNYPLVGTPVDVPTSWHHEGSPFMRLVDTLLPVAKPMSITHDLAMGDLLRNMFGGDQASLLYNVLNPATIPAYAVVEANSLGWQTTIAQGRKLGAQYMERE